MIGDRMQRQRFELKYVISESTALRLRPYISEYLELDEYGATKPNLSYPVNSLYLDGDEMNTFWNWVNADRNRYKLRIRFYDDNPETPAFFEIKRRLGNCIHKERCGVAKSAVPSVLAGQMPPPDTIRSRDHKHIIALQNFISVMQRINARPKMLVTYMREAYLEMQEGSVRITFDRLVRMSPRTTADFSLNPERFVQPFGDQVILEIKFTNRFPHWARHMVEINNLSRDGAAKYCEGVAAFYAPRTSNWREQPSHLAASEDQPLNPSTGRLLGRQ